MSEVNQIKRGLDVKVIIVLSLFLGLPLIAGLLSALVDVRKLPFVIKKNGTQQSSISTTSQSQFPTADPVKTTNWKIYVNNKEGYQIKYPSNLFLKEDNSHGSLNVIFSTKSFESSSQDGNGIRTIIKDYSSAKESSFQIDVSLPYDENDLEKDVRQRFSGPIKSQRVMINNMNVFIVDEGTGNIAGVGASKTKYYYTRARNGNVYSIATFIGLKDLESEEIFNLMLGSFTLI